MQALFDHLQQVRPRARPWIVGVTGAVASGKSTLADQLVEAIQAWPGAPSVVQFSTDGFLYSNAELTRRGALARKGYPETYDQAGLWAALADLRKGSATIPVHSHNTYDIDPLLARVLAPTEVVIAEGLGFGGPANPAPVDYLIYLDANEADLETWYVDRFLGFCRAARTDPASFYARFAHLDEAGVCEVAKMVWHTVNLPNLREHISPLCAEANVVVRKSADHQIERLQIQP